MSWRQKTVCRLQHFTGQTPTVVVGACYSVSTVESLPIVVHHLWAKIKNLPIVCDIVLPSTSTGVMFRKNE